MSSPLTTTFTPPASCASQWTVLASGPVTLVNYVSLTDFSLISTCYPSGVESVDEPLYSPGLICPSGYTTAFEGTLIANSQYIKYCCPSGFAYQSDNVTCTTSFTSTVVFSVDKSGSTHTSTFQFGQAWAEPVGLLYAPGDLQLTATTTTSGTTATTTGTSASATASSSTNPTLSNSEHAWMSALSAGAKTGIAVGVILGVALLALGLFMALRYRRKRLVDSDTAPTVTDQTMSEPEEKQVVGGIPHLGVSELQGHDEDPRAELYSHEVHELPGATTPDSELPGSEAVYQLPAEPVVRRLDGHGNGCSGSPTLGSS